MSTVQPLSRLPLLGALLLSCAGAHAADAPVPTSVGEAYRAVFQDSIDNRRGIVLHVNGQVVQGAVVRIIGADAVELRNQQHGRIVVRIDRIDGIAAP